MKKDEKKVMELSIRLSQGDRKGAPYSNRCERVYNRPSEVETRNAGKSHCHTNLQIEKIMTEKIFRDSTRICSCIIFTFQYFNLTSPKQVTEA